MTLAYQESEKQEETPKTATSSRRVARAAIRMLSGLTILIALVLCAAMLAGSLDRWIPALDSLAQFRWQCMWLLLVLGAILFACKRWVWAGISVAFALPSLLVGLAFLLPVAEDQSASSPNAPSHRLLVLNVLYSNEQYEKVLDLIDRVDPDTICLAEFNRYWKRGLADLDETYPFQATDPRYGDRGVKIYCKWPIVVASGDDTVPKVRDRPIVVARIQSPGRPFTLVGIHTSSPTSLNRAAQRNRQLDEIVQVIRNVPSPIVCCGDFNSTTWSSHMQGFLRDAGLRDSRWGFGRQATWPSWLHLAPLQIAIDHVFVSEGITIENRRVESYVGSDHFPVVVDFSFAECAGGRLLYYRPLPATRLEAPVL